MKPHDISGQRFGRLVALEVARRDNSHSYWRARCDCGNETTQTLNALRRGTVVSCGCRMREAIRERMTTHGKSQTSTYRIWNAMRNRCTNPNVVAWPNYGGRGIAVCDRWLNSFENFLADMGERPPELTLDRIDNDGNYEPGNCRWADRSTQALNQRPRKRIAA